MWVHLLGRRLANTLTDPDFDLLLDWPYWNRFGRKGHSYYGQCNGRRFCMSQSACEGPDNLAHLASILRNGDAIDCRVGPFYSNRRGQVGLLVAAWNGSQWLQMISPGTQDQPNDAYSQLTDKIRADKTFDPQVLDLNCLSANARLRELEDILKDLQGRRDFDW